MKTCLKNLIFFQLLILFCFNSLLIAGWQVVPTNSTAYLTSVYFNNALTGYIGGLNGFLSKTTDGGVSWAIQNPQMTSQFVRDISFVNENTGYICGDDGLIRKTTNGGINWNPLFSNTSSGIYGIDALDAMNVYASVNNGTVLKSSDGGLVFQTLNVSGNQLLTIDFCSADTGYTAGQGGVVYKTINGGLNWTSLNASTLNNFWDICALSNNNFYLAAYYGTLRRTSDGGNNFYSSFGYNLLYEDIQMVNTMIGYACTNDGIILKSSNGGNSWKQQATGSTVALSELFFVNSYTGYAAGVNGTLLKTTDGSDNIDVSVISPNNREVMTASEVFQIKWSCMFNGNVKIEYSLNNGTSWNIIENSVPAESFSYDWSVPSGNSNQCRLRITSVENPAHSDISDGNFTILSSNSFYNVPEVLYYKFNDGINTTPNYAVPGEFTGIANINGMQIRSGGLADSCLVGTGGNGTTNYVSTNWATCLPKSGWTIGFWISDISLGVDPNNAVYLFGDVTANNFRCYYGGAGGLTAVDTAIMFRCTGLTDIRIPVVKGQTYYIHIVYEPIVSQMKVYVNGILKQTNTQSPFIPIGNGPMTIGSLASFNSSLAQNMKFDEFRIYNRTLGQTEISATWNTTFPSIITSVKNDLTLTPDKFVLYENYPNPFNPSTKIKFDLPADFSNVRLTVFDILGKEVEILLNKNLKAGNYTVDFNASELSAGVYFYKLEAGDNILTRKMILIK